MKISGIAIGQWNENCKKKEGMHRTKFKIRRAIVLGKVSHVYGSKDYVVRYYDLNILISHTGLVMMVWRDRSREIHFVSEERKMKYDLETTNKQNVQSAYKKHRQNVKANESFYEQENTESNTFEVVAV